MNKNLLFKIYFGLLVTCTLFCTIDSYANVNSSIQQVLQEKKVTINVTNTPIKTILYSIQKQSGISFVFQNSADSEQLNNLSLNVKDVTVESALNSLFNNTSFTYKVVGKTITIVKKPTINNTSQQNITIKGKVLDESNTPVAGVTIFVLETSVGAVSDDKGGFSIKVKSNDEIEFSCVGFMTQNIRVDSNNDNLIVKLAATSIAVDDAIVTGFFNRKLSGYAGSLTVIKREELKKISTGNIFTTISALDAGFKINENNLAGSNPNVLPDFTIRGKGSFQNGSTAPIFILDGFEVTSEKIFDMDINRIETITLLKDASATILYGSRAANGVIVIETVAPKPGTVRVTYDFKPTIGIVDLRGYDLMNAAEKLEYEKLAGQYDMSSQYDQNIADRIYNQKKRNILEGTDTYWLSQPVQTSFSHAHSLFVEGGAENIRYGINAAYNGNSGVMKLSGRDRTELGFSLVYRIKDKVTIKNYISYGFTNAYNSPYGSYSLYGQLNPYEKIYDKNGGPALALLDGSPNPLYDATLPNRDWNKTQEMTEQLSVDWMIGKGFRFKGQVNYTKQNNNSEKYTSPLSSKYIYSEELDYSLIDVADRGELIMNNGGGMSLSSNATLSYNTTIKDKHIIFAGIGGEISQRSNSLNGYSLTGFQDDRFSDPAFAMKFLQDSRARSSEDKTRAIGMFANVNYIFDNRFFGDFSFRYDGSSQFGLDNKFAPFWSVGGGWNIHNEKSWFKCNAISLLKIRASYGVTGNQEFSAYQARTKFKFNTDRLYNSQLTSSLMGYGNPDLKWQNQYQTNIGIDFGLMESRLRISVNYYNKLTSGMLTSVTVAPGIGIPGDSYTANLGEIKNNGVELNVNAVLIRSQKKDFEWSMMLQGSNNKNTLLKISNQLKNINSTNNANKISPLAVYEEGESMSALKAVRSLGIDPTTGQEIYIKKDGTMTFIWDSADKVLCGDKEPIVYGNFGTNLFYKGWNLNLSFRYSFGAKLYNHTLAERVEGADPSFNADRRVLNDRWIKSGDNAKYKNIKTFSSTFVSTRFVQTEQLVQMSNLSLSYEFSKEMIKKLKLNSLRLSFYANDLFRASTIRNERGLDYPFQQSFVFGLNVGF